MCLKALVISPLGPLTVTTLDLMDTVTNKIKIVSIKYKYYDYLGNIS